MIEPTPSALIVEAADGQVFATRGVFKGDKLSAQDIPANLSRAIIAIEDRHFYEHGGFYLPSLLRAMIRQLCCRKRARRREHDYAAARAHDLSLAERTIKRKVQEAIFTMGSSARFGKEEILSRYLNTAYFGAGVYGVDAAAETLLRQDRERAVAQRIGDARGTSCVRLRRSLPPAISKALGSARRWCSRRWSRPARFPASRPMRRADNPPPCGCRRESAGNQLFRRHARWRREAPRRLRIHRCDRALHP